MSSISSFDKYIDAPWLPGLLSRPEVRKDIEYLLAAERDQNYHDTYLLLKTMQEKEL